MKRKIQRQKGKEFAEQFFGWFVLFVFCALVAVGAFYQERQVTESLNDIVSSIESNNKIYLVRAHKKQKEGMGMVSDNFLPEARLPDVDMERMKKQGCVTDGFLSGYGNEERNTKLINRLPCYYLHRAVETWLDVPNWEEVEKIKSGIVRRPVLYGMFIAEAIDRKAQYMNSETGEYFEFKKMCKPGTQGRWGEGTCVPDFDKKEYRKYVTQIMKEAIDHEIQVFLIGQAQVQDARRRESSDITDVLKDVRAYAAKRQVDIVIGAQTNDTTDKDYLRLFDFIEGGVGLHPDGSIEDGPCFSRYLEQNNWCWALLWHDKYIKKARNVFIHLDWSGMRDDDMATFTVMDERKRADVLKALHAFYTKKGIGFLLPVFTALPYNHDGCFGNKERYYSADKKYSCKDESVISDILTNYQ